MVSRDVRFIATTLIEGVVKPLIMTELLRTVARRSVRSPAPTARIVVFYANSGVKLANLRRDLSRESLSRQTSADSQARMPADRSQNSSQWDRIPGHSNKWSCAVTAEII